MRASLHDEPAPAMPLPGEAARTGLSTGVQVVSFTCNDLAYGIEITSVREIRSWTPTTELPGQSRGACGVLDIRGNVVEVFDLASMLGGTSRDGKSGQIVLVVSLGAHNIGILADAVSDIIDASPADLREVPANRLRNANDQYVSVLVKHEDRIIAVLNLEALFPNYVV